MRARCLSYPSFTLLSPFSMPHFLSCMYPFVFLTRLSSSPAKDHNPAYLAVPGWGRNMQRFIHQAGVQFVEDLSSCQYQSGIPRILFCFCCIPASIQLPHLNSASVRRSWLASFHHLEKQEGRTFSSWYPTIGILPLPTQSMISEAGNG